MTDSVWRELSIPSGVSVWRDGVGQILSAVHVSSSGFTWCQPAGAGLPPQSPEEVSLRSGREFFPLADDEKTEVAAAPNGLLERLVATAGVPQVETFTPSSSTARSSPPSRFGSSN